jgi:D-alanyl-D-alanine carboxypeptidase (penicillin-binding protein 5/6)
MKILALIVILALHATGLWPHLSDSNRQQLTSRATLSAPIASTSTAAAEAPGPIQPLPIRTTTDTLDLNTAAAIAIDRQTATVLYSKNAGAHRPIASVTKLVTALVILSRHKTDEIVTIPTLPEYPVEAETIGLIAGDRFKIGDLLEGVLVPSGNDAADALAIIDSGSIPKFASRMNAKMTEWGIEGTHFASPSGLQDSGNFTSAAALGKIAGLSLDSPFLTKTVGLTDVNFTSSSGRSYNLKTTNQLLASGQFYGIKTGYTLAAGECFVGLTRVNGHEVITVVLGADNRFGATTTLTNWIGHNWQWL